MKWKLINSSDVKTFAVVLGDGEEVIGCLADFAKQNNLKASQFTGIGAFRQLTLGFFDFTRKDYLRTEIREQVELLSLIGDITLNDDKHLVHPHVVVGKADCTAHGGHLLRAIVHPTLELIINESPGYLQRALNRQTGLPLITI